MDRQDTAQLGNPPANENLRILQVESLRSRAGISSVGSEVVTQRGLQQACEAGPSRGQHSRLGVGGHLDDPPDGVAAPLDGSHNTEGPTVQQTSPIPGSYEADRVLDVPPGLRRRAC